MKKLLVTVLMATAAAIGRPPQDAQHQGPPKSDAKVLTRGEFDAWLGKPGQILIVDVRRPDEIKDIGGFPVYLNVQMGDLAHRLDWIPRDRTIITVSNHAARGGRAADILTKAGFKVAGTIGAQTYEQAGGTLDHIAIPAAQSNGTNAGRTRPPNQTSPETPARN